jgi:hypothetical protein
MKSSLPPAASKKDHSSRRDERIGSHLSDERAIALVARKAARKNSISSPLISGPWINE